MGLLNKLGQPQLGGELCLIWPYKDIDLYDIVIEVIGMYKNELLFT